ncbi:MAG: folK [Gammaproteobacteria bacterium]|jgi:2-amino-4-hydroxy-6-hydroxymethyldihydropteridine diphosphokinase|nr:folK [Gammaproteobacteria bacterium]
MPLKVKAYLGLGSNLNNPVEQIKQAIVEIAEFETTAVLAQSSLYESAPLGPQDQPHFINAVLAIETELSPLDLLKACQTLELKHGRVKKRHWGERTLDIDILLYGNEIIDLPELTVPHKGLKQRNFVIQPLAEIAPDLCLASGETVKNLNQNLQAFHLNKI